MPRSVENMRDYLRLVARLLWQPGVQRRLDLSDVVQETVRKAHEKGDQFRGNTEAEWRGWLRAILRNELRQAVRANPPGEVSLDESSRHWEEVLAADHSSPSERVLREEQLAQLADALGQLLEDERTAVELKHLHDCSVEFIGQHMGRTKDAVAGLLKRGMHKLRLLLNGPGEQEKG
jgi:RNA polymerase sigma-70 factor (ECF subfamily)